MSRTPNAAERKIIELYTGADEPSVFQLAARLNIPPVVLHDIISEFVYNGEGLSVRSPMQQLTAQKALNPPEETTMAKKDKNKAERDKHMSSLREGTPIYGIPMDSIRGLLPEMEQGECFIIQKQGGADKVSMRLGDVSYSQ